MYLFIFIIMYLIFDGSYFIFFRFCAFVRSLQHQSVDKIEEDVFLTRFKNVFIKKFKEIPQKLNIDNTQNLKILVALDCPRNNIWRKSIYPPYKENRHGNLSSEYNQNEIFKIIKDESWFRLAGANIILKHPQLEADDCIALFVKNNQSDEHVIITGDHDYLQLSSSNVKIFDLKFNSLTSNKKSFDNKEKDLFCKIVAGDKSDNIPSVFPRCGIKTASKFYENKESFNKKLNTMNYLENYNLNKTLIDFDMIPQNLIDDFNTNHYNIYY